MANQQARRLRRDMTDAERKLWWRLRYQQLPGHRFRRQVPLGDYIVDFACLDSRLVIEVDGDQHAARVDRDARRTAWLESRGYRVLRFWNLQVLQETEDVMEAIWLALDSPPTLTLPLKGGGKSEAGDQGLLGDLAEG